MTQTIPMKTVVSMLRDNGRAIDRYYAELKTVIGKEDDRSIWATDRLIKHLTYLETEAAFLELSILNNEYIEQQSPPFPPIRGFENEPDKTVQTVFRTWPIMTLQRITQDELDEIERIKELYAQMNYVSSHRT